VKSRSNGEQRFFENAQIRLFYGFSLLPSYREDGVREVERGVELGPYEPWYLITAAFENVRLRQA
jgi:hypothetical protein